MAVLQRPRLGPPGSQYVPTPGRISDVKCSTFKWSVGNEDSPIGFRSVLYPCFADWASSTERMRGIPTTKVVHQRSQTLTTLACSRNRLVGLSDLCRRAPHCHGTGQLDVVEKRTGPMCIVCLWGFGMPGTSNLSFGLKIRQGIRARH